MPVLLFCQRASDRVDVHVWNGKRAQIRCLTCGHECWLDGFTVSEFDPAKLLTAAIVDQARKLRKRPPGLHVHIQGLRKFVLRHATFDRAHDHQVLLHGGEAADALVVGKGLVVVRDETLAAYFLSAAISV